MVDTKRPTAVGTVQLEDARSIVTEWRFPPGAETGWHRHGHDYVVVPITTGALQIESKDGVTSSDLVTGVSYSRKVGVEHNVINDNEYEFVFVEVEFK